MYTQRMKAHPCEYYKATIIMFALYSSTCENDTWVRVLVKSSSV